MNSNDPENGAHVVAGGALRSYTSDPPIPVFGASPHMNGGSGVTTPSAGKRVLRVSSVMRAIATAAERTTLVIAETTKQSPETVHGQLREVIDWLGARLGPGTSDDDTRPPIVPRDYVTAFRTNLLRELDVARGLDAREVVRALKRVDEAGEAWKRTDRGKFISRLTGSDCADAVVAIAHDIRSPLCSILLLVDALRRAEKAQKSPIRDRQLGLIYSAALGLSTTVSNLIDAARGAGLVHGHPMPFSVTEIMLGVSAIVQPMCEEKGIPLNVRFPQSDARIGHASAIHQALLNLTSNAVRYTEEGSVTLGCNEVSGNHVEFWIQDTGPGISDQVLEQFCYGFPPEGAPLRFSSAGLGLAIVRALVEAMNSTLQVDTGGNGTRFCFILELPQIR